MFKNKHQILKIKTLITKNLKFMKFLTFENYNDETVVSIDLRYVPPLYSQEQRKSS